MGSFNLRKFDSATKQKKKKKGKNSINISRTESSANPNPKPKTLIPTCEFDRLPRVTEARDRCRLKQNNLGAKIDET